MRKFYNKYKWRLHGTVLSLMVVSFVILAALFLNEMWIGNILQALGTVGGMYLTLIIFLVSKEESDKQFIAQLEHLQKQTDNQIQAVRESNEKSIAVQQESIKQQIEAIQKSTEAYLDGLNSATEKQILQLEENANKQISSFENNIKEVTSALSENAILLGEILSRELEKAVELYESHLNSEVQHHRGRQGFKLFRTTEEKEIELNRIKGRIDWMKKKVNGFVTMYNKLRDYLGSGNHKRLLD